MTPTPELRLQTLIKAMEEVIIPALGAHESLAREQAAIAVLHLKVLRDQSAYASDYARQCLLDLLDLARALVACAGGGRQTSEAAGALEKVADSCSASGGMRFEAALQRDTVALAIDVLIDATAVDAAPDCLAASQALILNYGYHQAARDRAWFAGTHIDPDAATLPGPAAIVSAWRRKGATP